MLIIALRMKMPRESKLFSIVDRIRQRQSFWLSANKKNFCNEKDHTKRNLANKCSLQGKREVVKSSKNQLAQN